jgi:toxin CptA
MPDGHSELEPPLPIPNRAVKRLSADDSADYPCESRTSSGTHDTKTPRPKGWGVFVCASRSAPTLPPGIRISTKDLSRHRTRGLRVTTGMLRLELRSSGYIAAVVIAAHAAAMATILPLDVPIAAKMVLVVLIVVSMPHALWHDALLRSRRAFTVLELRETGEVTVQTRDGEWHDAQILGTSYVSPTLSAISLRLAHACRTRHIIFVPDNCDPEQFRRLRVYLRWGYKGAAMRART